VVGVEALGGAMASTKFFTPKKGRLFLALGGALVAAYFFSSWMTAAPAPKYETVKVVRGDIEDTILSSGVLQAIRQVDVGTRATGQLKSLKVNLGDHVHAGDLVAEIDPVLQQNELRAAQASLAALEAQERAAAAKWRRAKLELERQRGLIGGAATSRRDLETAEADLQSGEAERAALAAQIAQAKSGVDIAAANLDYTKILAPIDGEVVAILTREGQTVVATQIVPVILKLAQLDAMTVKTQVSEADVINVRVGQRASFTIMGDPDKRYAGSVRVVEPAPQNFSEPQTGSIGAASGQSSSGAALQGAVFYSALFDIPNPDRVLRIGMTAQVSIVQGVAKGALTIPAGALREQEADGRYALRVLDAKGRGETRRVRVGVNNHVTAQVLEGLKEGDDVILGDAAPTRGAGS
jgi:macrolide-specific efflux system membrane fusion protein